ncbi:MAG TPA: hypothetical protein VG838_16510 [Opitutaceae bacterium]|nr:hypothetical protein [Opitutaceae bacterium]
MSADPVSHLPPPAHEPTDARVAFILVVAGAVVAGILLCLLASAVLQRAGDFSRRPAGPETTFRHGAAEEGPMAADWREQEAAVRDHLGNYAWVDRAGGIVRIPLARAIELEAAAAGVPKGGTP